MAEAQLTSPRVAERPWWRGVAVGMFAVGWGANQFTSLLVAYREERGISTATSDGLFGIYAVALIVALLLGGPAADRYGRRRIVFASVVATVLASVLLMTGTHAIGMLFVGRFVAGLASGGIFAAGTAWVKELSSTPYDRTSDAGAGARRAALAISLGFGLGPLTTGIVAQWAPHPLVTAYLPHLVIGLLALPVVWRAPETVPAPEPPGYLARLRIRGVGSRQFLGVVAPAAIWVFAGPSVAMAVLPGLVSAHLSGYAIVFGGVAAVVTLGTGVAVQRVAHRLRHPVNGSLLALGAIVGGLLLAALTAHTGDPVLALVSAVPLGAGYGLGLVSGLLETQRLARPDELAGLTAVYYALTYLGFGLPLLLAWLDDGYPAMLCTVAGVALICAGIVRVFAQPATLRSESAAEVR